MILMLVIIKVFTLFIFYLLFIWNGLLIGNWLNNVQQKRKGTQGIIEIENPNLVKAKNLKARDVDVSFGFNVFLVIILDREVMLLLFGVFRLGKQRSFQGVKGLHIVY